MKRLIALSLVLALAGCGGVYRDRSVPISSAAGFDPARYVGTWYEIASFPAPFQGDCENTRATYGLRADGTVSVLNECTSARDGSPRRISGSAEVVGPGRLSVRLAGVPFAAPYWVLWVDADYRTAVVGVPSGRAGWILSRTPDLPPDRLKAALEVLEFNGYDVSELSRTPQDQAAARAR